MKSVPQTQNLDSKNDSKDRNSLFSEISNLYSEYYKYAIKRKWLEIPTDLPHREIGFGITKKVDNRNICFENNIDYLKWVLKNSPLHLYKSLSYMEHPENMGGANQKKLFRREIAFDIDTHKTEKCKHEENWLCEHCLEEAKNQTLILIDEYLIPFFGFSKNDLKIVFSGNRGYHIYIDPKNEQIKEEIEHWGKNERRYFIEFILGKNLSLNHMGSAWKTILTNQFKKNKFPIKSFKNSNNWDKELNKATREKSKPLLLDIINKTKNRLELDEKVMDDDIRLLRTVGSLHGFTGFMVKEIKYDTLSNGFFEPLSDAVFSEFSKTYYDIRINTAIDEVTIKNEQYTKESKEVPASLLLFLYGHGVNFEILKKH
ncbi:DNA primase catalytic subunit PriS [Methanococcus voltae]|uniref:DNA primase small subunit PriS n=1 Tax=Methanococcus voltae TaxID=2188 RepID=A0A8J7RI16_METVO|nr:DNA primase catalytic subunit PriS [Methanococcus voltae]MBP2172740.1 DNA primase small subunit [Methanococcus voltae]MBP2201850.1 DNA primase small subunit [Methanococcus voltae]